MGLQKSDRTEKLSMYVICKARYKVWQILLNLIEGMPVSLLPTVIHLNRMAY